MKTTASTQVPHEANAKPTWRQIRERIAGFGSSTEAAAFDQYLDLIVGRVIRDMEPPNMTGCENDPAFGEFLRRNGGTPSTSAQWI